MVKEEEKPVVIAVIPKDALVMDADQMRAGTTRFLNGNWRAQMDISDAHTGKAPSLRYQIQNNKGTVRLVREGNIVCKASVTRNAATARATRCRKSAVNPATATLPYAPPALTPERWYR